MRLIVNADDFGLTRGITDTILEAVDGGAVTGVSVVPNGYAFAYAQSALQRRPAVRVAAHLNLVEGIPAAPAEEVSGLLKAGRLENSFQSLWLRHRKASPAARQSLVGEVRAELSAQLRRFTDAFGDEAKNVDSHQHVHMVPFIFDILIDLAKLHGIRFVRVPREAMVIPRTPGELRRSFPANAVKHVLLNRLSARAIPRLERAGISYCERFIGVQFTGAMTETVVARALRQISNRVGSEDVVEVLFHPGEARPDEASMWAGRERLRDYYLSPQRAREREVVRSASFAGLIAEYDAA